MRRFRSRVRIAYSRALSTIRRSRSSDSRSACSVSRRSLTSRTIATAAVGRSRGVEHRRHRGAHPDDGTVAAHVALLHLERRAVGGEAAERLDGPGPVVGMDERERRRADQRLGRAPGDQREAGVDEGDPAVEVDVGDAGGGLGDDGAEQRLRLAQRFADAAPLGDVDEGQHDAGDAVLAAAVRQQAGAGASRSPKRTSRSIGTRLSSTARGVGVELRVVEPVGEVAERPADVGVDQVEQLDRRRREERDAQLAVEEHGGDRRRGHQVLQVAVGVAQLVDLALELLVDGGQLLVDRLQLLAAGLELLGGRAQLLVHRLQLFVARLQLLR